MAGLELPGEFKSCTKIGFCSPGCKAYVPSYENQDLYSDVSAILDKLAVCALNYEERGASSVIFQLPIGYEDIKGLLDFHMTGGNALFMSGRYCSAIVSYQ
jgi:hypothetical protein